MVKEDSCRKYVKSRSSSYFKLVLLLLILFNNLSALSNPTLTVDVWTNRGGPGTSLDGGTFLVGETVVFYYSVKLAKCPGTLLIWDVAFVQSEVKSVSYIQLMFIHSCRVRIRS